MNIEQLEALPKRKSWNKKRHFQSHEICYREQTDKEDQRFIIKYFGMKDGSANRETSEIDEHTE
jgi:hypothetical protein